MQGLGAGLLTLNDIINVNKKLLFEDIRSFFQVMEVFGHTPDLWVQKLDVLSDSSEIAGFKEQDRLELLRRKSLKQINEICKDIN